MGKFLSEEWIKEYAKLWNSDSDLTEGLKTFSAKIKYYIDESDNTPVYIDVEKGIVTESGVVTKDEKFDFEMWATPKNWEIIINGQMGPKAAMLTKKLNFKGSMITAMKYMSAFEKSITLMSRVPTA